jgi:hypothetical protein
MAELAQGTKVILTQEDATIFLAFKEHREKFLALLEGGAFALTSGKVLIDVHNGQFQNIHIQNLTYKRKSAILETVLPA